MNWTNAPIGMIQLDELLNLLTALEQTGGCDNRTLAIVARATGVGDYLKPPAPAPLVVIELPKAIEARGMTE